MKQTIAIRMTIVCQYEVQACSFCMPFPRLLRTLRLPQNCGKLERSASLSFTLLLVSGAAFFFFFFFFMNGNTEQAQCALSRVCIP